MPIKSKICKLCNASFVPDEKNQEYCNICLKFKERMNKRKKRELILFSRLSKGLKAK